MKLRQTIALLGAASLLVSSASAQSMLINFDDATNPFSGGVISTAYALSGSNSLLFGNRVVGNFDLPAEYLNQNLQITMNVLDLGKWATTNLGGPHWGIAGGTLSATESAGVGTIQRSFAPSSAGYVAPVGYTIAALDWFSVAFITGSTRATLSATSDDSSISATPTWTQWTFNVSPTGSVTITSSETATPFLANLVGPDTFGVAASRITLRGGKDAALDTIYVDDISITVVPEPATFALLLGGLGLLTVLIRRRRR
jgi:hypothetical protein